MKQTMTFNAIIFLCFLLGSSALAARSTENSLESWSIPFKACTIPFVPLYTNLRTSCGEFFPGQSPPTYVFLSRQGSYSYTAVLECNQACPATLNPPGFEYGSIPKVFDITSSTATALFGKPSIGADFNSYALYDKSGGLFELDLSFSNDRVAKYRVRTKQLRIRPDWVSVQKTGAEENDPPHQ